MPCRTWRETRGAIVCSSPPQGSMSKEVEINTTEVERLFSELDGADMRKAMNTAVRRSGTLLRTVAESNFLHLKTRHSSGSGALRPNRQRGSRGHVVALKTPRRSRVPMAVVSLSPRLGADFLARFFEFGTGERMTKGHRRIGRMTRGRQHYILRRGAARRTGRLMAGDYFSRARRATARVLQTNTQRELIKAMRRIANKKKKP